MSEALLPANPWRRRLVSALLLFHLIAVPAGSYFAVRNQNRGPVAQFLAHYVQAIRVQQFWELFSPEPRKEAIRYHAEIRFRDGSVKTWQRPYPPKWDFFARHLSYNYQKWDLVSNYLDYRSSLWDGLAHFLSERFRNDENPVTEIRWIRSSAPWPAPRPSGYVGGEAAELQWTDQTIFVWDATRRSFL